MPTVRIAIGQIVCLDGDRVGNLARIANAVEEAKRADADIVCLPEMALLGWVNPDAHQRAHPIPGEDSQALCTLARDHKIHLCVGLAEKVADCLYDTALLIDDAGQILLKHRKINLLAELMTPPYMAGQEVRVAETRLGRIGLLICADTHESEILARMAELEPKLVLVPYGYAAREEAWPGHGKALENVVINTAKTIGAGTIGTNLIGQITHGPWRGMTYGGHSVAADKTGRVLALGKDLDRDIRIIALPLDP
ncbi:MAG: carbon-nitrogen hydrolase family protein [Phycisphaerales bacterium]|nr:MAG: carbon-nitrogen hydrolase family protein [Phycisphaerales bacterium]